MRRLPVVLGLVLVTGCSAGAPPDEPRPTGDIEAVETFDDLANDHREGPLTYDQQPPVGGPHNPRWMACDVYDEPVPDELAVHSLEHGAVWVLHEPDLPADEVELLAALTEIDEQYVLVSPEDDLPSPVVASAWGLQLQLDSADDPRLEQFVQKYAGGAQGGEPGVPCRDGGLGLQEAREAVGG